MIIYLLLNTKNNKTYVGQTKGHELSKRWNRNLSNVKVNQHLTAAIKKYGPEAFTRRILSHASCRAELDLLEKFWIRFFRSDERKYGYNKEEGGIKWSGEHTPEVRHHISEQIKRVWARKSPKERWEFKLAVKLRWLSRTERERKQISQKIAKAHLGMQTTEATKKKISKSVKKYVAQKRRLP